MIRKIIIMLLLFGILLNVSSCALLKGPIDKKTGFSNQLEQTANYIRSEDWEKARTNLDTLQKTWKKIKPLLQVDIDHDYVNSIEGDFIKLVGYIETNEKPDSLATILLIQDTWENIGSL